MATTNKYSSLEDMKMSSTVDTSNIPEKEEKCIKELNMMRKLFKNAKIQYSIFLKHFHYT